MPHPKGTGNEHQTGLEVKGSDVGSELSWECADPICKVHVLGAESWLLKQICVCRGYQP